MSRAFGVCFPAEIFVHLKSKIPARLCFDVGLCMSGCFSVVVKKQILIDQLKPGMFLIGMDQSWWKTPFLTHHRLIKNEAEIQLLRKAGVRKVVIDIKRGRDLEEDQINGCDRHPETVADNIRALEEPASIHTPLRPNEVSSSSGSESEEAKTDFSTGRDIPIEQAPNFPRLLKTAKEVHCAAVLAIERIFEGVVTGAPIDNPALQYVVQSILDSIFENSRVLPQVALVQNLQRVDSHLYSHVVNVCAFATMLGVELGLPQEQLEWLATGALLHDVGYMRLPRNLFRKRKEHTEEEEALLRQHTDLGVAMVVSCSGVAKEVQRIIAEHHERQDGSGFPKGLVHPEISALSDLVALCDCFDSMTGSWGIPPPIPASMALRQLYGEAKAGKLTLPPAERLIKCLGVYPLGSLVELSTGERGVIVGINPEDMLRPSIKLMVDSEGKPFPVPWVVNLASPPDGQPQRGIRVLLNPAEEGIEVVAYLHHLCW